MARSLDELIRFLLDEIALSGQQGESTHFPKFHFSVFSHSST
jgi:hypothetical protein